MNQSNLGDLIFGGVGPGCPNCGSTSLHACTGQPAHEWTDEERDALRKALEEMFAEEETVSKSATTEN